MKRTSDQILIRDWELKDLDIFEFWNTGNHLWMKFDGPYYPKPSQKDLEKRFIMIKEHIIVGNWITPRKRIVIADIKNDKLLGTVSWYWQSKETNWKSIGIAIYNDKYWSKGIGYEALSLWIDYLFEVDKDIVRLDLRTWSGNIGMIKLSEKLGFKEEARFRNARIVEGKFYDSIGMGILREEWKKGF